LMALVALGVNDAFGYSRYFQTAPWGADASTAMARGFFEVASTRPQVKSVALVGLDVEAAASVLRGARAEAKRIGLSIVYARTYPTATTDLGRIVRAIKTSTPDAVFVASIRLTRSEWSELHMKPASRRPCSAEPWLGCNMPRFEVSSARAST